jgi:hypothetical protein
MGGFPLTAYPGFDQYWQDNTNEIDQQLADYYFSKTEQSAQAMDEVTRRIEYWLDNQDLDERVKAEWAQIKAQGNLFGDMLHGRVSSLIQDGKIRFARKQELNAPG